jgi:hypothetical protein
MDKSEEDVVAEVLDDVLKNDGEIRKGATNAGVELEDLKSALLLRREDVLDATLAERNRLDEYTKERSKLESQALIKEWNPRWYVRIWRDAFWVILSLLLLGCIIMGLATIFGWAMSFSWFWHKSNLVLSAILIIGTFAIGLTYLAVKWFNTRSARLITSSPQYQLLKNQENAAEGNWRAAIREKGVKSLLREEINSRQPSYSTTLDIDKNNVAGLAELRDPLYYINTSAQASLNMLLKSMPGASLGISGPRGAGKTTLLRKYCAPELHARGEDTASIRVLVSAPVVYDAREFILYLFASVCQAIVASSKDRPRGFRPEWIQANSTGRPSFTSRLLLRWLWLLLPLAMIWGCVLLLSVFFDWKLNTNLQPAIILVIVGVTGTYTYWRTRRYDYYRARGQWEQRQESFPGESDILSTASTLLFGLAYQQSFAQGWTGGVKLPIGAEFGVTSNTTMTEKPMGFPEIVSRFNSFLELAANDEREIYIGIDELDKIDSEEKVYQFLNDIKGIFGLENCYYLISISQNAMSAFERRGLPLRDAFDSAFDAVVDVGYLDAAGSRRLLQRRVIRMPMAYLDFCYVISGGLPRDLIRIARDLVALTEPNKAEKGLTTLVTQVIRSDVARKREAAIVSAQGIGIEPDASDLLGDLNAFDVSKVSCDTLFESCQYLLPGPGAVNGEQSDAIREPRQQIARIRTEMSAYYYYSSTILAFFNDSLSIAKLKRAETDSGPASVDQLARARQAFSVNPRLAWTAISAFRQAWTLDTVEFSGATAGKA